MPKGESAAYPAIPEMFGFIQAAATERGVFVQMIDARTIIVSPEHAERFGAELIHLAEWVRILQEKPTVHA